jgi:hypothetical protein
VSPFDKLRPYQTEHAERLLAILKQRGAALDHSDTGCGKTHVALALCKALDTVPIVIGPKAARFGWEQAGAIQGIEFDYVNYELARVRKRRGEEMLTDTEWLTEHKHGQGSYLKWKNCYDTMIFDEVHRCASVDPTLNSKMLIAAKRQGSRILALSATAAENPLQMKALGFALGMHTLSKSSPLSKTTWYDFLYRYGCKPGVFGGWQWDDEDPDNAKYMLALHASLSKRASALKKAEIPGFPRNQLEVMLLQDENGHAKELTERLHEIYAMRKAQAVEADERENALVAGLREEQALEILMLPALVGLAVDYVQSSRVIFFVNYRQTREELCKALDAAGVFCQFIDGTQIGARGEAERRGIIDRFQHDCIPALVVNTYAGSESLNLQGRMNRTTFTLPVKSGRRAEQIIGRAHRDGGADALQFFCFFAGTRQEETARRMQAKQMNLKLLNDGDYLF